MNNRIYGLTKGQASPTSEKGKVTKFTPRGSVDEPIIPVSIALAAGATFVARSVGADGEHLREVLRRAALHRGLALVEVLQNCAIFNDGAWDEVAAPAVRDDRLLRLGHGQPMVFGKERNKGIRLRGLTPEVVSLDGAVPWRTCSCMTSGRQTRPSRTSWLRCHSLTSRSLSGSSAILSERAIMSCSGPARLHVRIGKTRCRTCTACSRARTCGVWRANRVEPQAAPLGFAAGSSDRGARMGGALRGGCEAAPLIGLCFRLPQIWAISSLAETPVISVPDDLNMDIRLDTRRARSYGLGTA
jgi:hypothetical protein